MLMKGDMVELILGRERVILVAMVCSVELFLCFGSCGAI